MNGRSLKHQENLIELEIGKEKIKNIKINKNMQIKAIIHSK